MYEEARYIYSIARTGKREVLGEIGIDKRAVYTVPHKDISAVVHACEPKPYDTRDKSQAEGWVLEHSYVIDQATKRFGSVLPISFDVILRGDDSLIKEWLARNYEHLHRELEGVAGKAEYTIQIYYDYNELASKVLSRTPELNDLHSRIEKESKGKAYLLSKKLDQRLKSLVASEAKCQAERYVSSISSQVEELIADSKSAWTPDGCQNLHLLASYTCLVSQDKVEGLGETLDQINCLEGFSVRFTGPWAPFSFVKLPGAEAKPASATNSPRSSA
jgi:hypothetical protein